MYISQHKHLGRGKGSQLNSSSKKQQQLKVMDQKVSRSVIMQNRSSPFRPNADHPLQSAWRWEMLTSTSGSVYAWTYFYARIDFYAQTDFYTQTDFCFCIWSWPQEPPVAYELLVAIIDDEWSFVPCLDNCGLDLPPLCFGILYPA